MQEISLDLNDDPDIEYNETISQTENGRSESQFSNLSSSIPSGYRAINLPISFFGDISIMEKGDMVDIVSVLYDSSSSELYSEVILAQKKIIMLGCDEDMRDQETVSGSDYLSGGIFGDLPSNSGGSNQLKKTLIITFYLKPEEVENAFMAIEGGQLYLSLCPAEMGDERF